MTSDGIYKMLPKEIIKKIKKIEISTNRLVNDMLAGNYHSAFKGKGMEFVDVREYQFGDDVRNIDWNVTARTGQPFVKRFAEERELTVLLCVDASSSGEFGTTGTMKGEIAAEICALFAFSAIKNNDRVGLLVFTDEVELFVPPKKGKKHVLRVIRELLYFHPKSKKTNINCALEYVRKLLKRKGVVLLVSDFIDKDFTKSLRIVNKYHDVIAISIFDQGEREIPDVGIVELEDAETGELIMADTSDPSFQKLFLSYSKETIEGRRKIFNSSGIDYIEINTKDSYIFPLVSFFKNRSKRINR